MCSFCRRLFRSNFPSLLQLVWGRDSHPCLSYLRQDMAIQIWLF